MFPHEEQAGPPGERRLRHRGLDHDLDEVAWAGQASLDGGARRGMALLERRQGCEVDVLYLAGLSQIAPQIDPTRLAELPALARGFEYAEKLKPKEASDRAIDGALTEVSPLRQVALAYLDAAVWWS